MRTDIMFKLPRVKLTGVALRILIKIDFIRAIEIKVHVVFVWPRMPLDDMVAVENHTQLF